MATKDRDYAELIAFQKAGMEFGANIQAVVSRLQASSDSARSELKDPVAERSFQRISDLLDTLTSLGRTVESDMQNYLQKSIRDAEDFDNL